MIKKYHPDLKVLREKIDQAMVAMETLINRGVEIQTISLREPAPVFTVTAFPGIRLRDQTYIGQGMDEYGRHEWHATLINKCMVKWRVPK